MWLSRFAHRRSVADRPPPAQVYVPPVTPEQAAIHTLQGDFDQVLLAKDYFRHFALATPKFTEPPKHYRRVFEIIRDLSPAAMDLFVRDAVAYGTPDSLAILLDIYPFY